jgi:hypothetical protein
VLLPAISGDAGELGSPATCNRSDDKSEKIAALSNNLNADDDQDRGKNARLLHKGISQGKKNKQDQNNGQDMQAKHQACRKSYQRDCYRRDFQGSSQFKKGVRSATHFLQRTPEQRTAQIITAELKIGYSAKHGHGASSLGHCFAAKKIVIFPKLCSARNSSSGYQCIADCNLKSRWLSASPDVTARRMPM